MLAALETGGNASSIHAEGQLARRRIDLAREQVAVLVGAHPGMVIFTSGGTEANNLAVRGARVDRLIISASEHPAVTDAARASGKPVEIVPIDSEGLVDLDFLAHSLAQGNAPGLVSVMLANNETGVLQPVQEIVKIAQEHDALVHTDAVQAAGMINMSFLLLGVDMLTLSAHKLGGPQGIGALVVREGLELDALVLGGGQELRMRGGTENLPGISGFGAATVTANKNVDKNHSRIKRLRDELQSQLLEATPEAQIFSGASERLPNTVCFAHPGMTSEMLLIAFDLEGVAVSSGSACSSGKVTRSTVLEAMGVEENLAAGAIRVSLGWNSTETDVAHFADVWRQITRRHSAHRDTM